MAGRSSLWIVLAVLLVVINDAAFGLKKKKDSKSKPIKVKVMGAPFTVQAGADGNSAIVKNAAGNPTSFSSGHKVYQKGKKCTFVSMQGKTVTIKCGGKTSSIDAQALAQSVYDGAMAIMASARSSYYDYASYKYDGDYDENDYADIDHDEYEEYYEEELTRMLEFLLRNKARKNRNQNRF